MRLLMEKIKQRIKENSHVASFLAVLSHTPRHLVHWYALLLLGILVSLVLSVIAWAAFVGGTDLFGAQLPGDSSGTTFNQEELQEILDTYKTQRESFEVLKRNVPSIIDPGR